MAASQVERMPHAGVDTSASWLKCPSEYWRGEQECPKWHWSSALCPHDRQGCCCGTVINWTLTSFFTSVVMFLSMLLEKGKF